MAFFIDEALLKSFLSTSFGGLGAGECASDFVKTANSFSIVRAADYSPFVSSRCRTSSFGETLKAYGFGGEIFELEDRFIRFIVTAFPIDSRWREIAESISKYQ